LKNSGNGAKIMKIAYVTSYDARHIGKSRVDEWSGLGYYIAQSLKQQSFSLEYVGPLEDRLISKITRKLKRHYYQLQKKQYIKDTEPIILKNYAQQVAAKLANIEADLVFSATINPIVYLECKQPIVFWCDSTFAAIENFYPQYSNLCDESSQNGHLMEEIALQKCKLAIYASDWAAKSAIERYKVDPQKVKVVPFGANIQGGRTFQEIEASIEARSSNKCKLLFLGIDWLRKGGDIALEVAKKLNQQGLPVELTIVGCEPVSDEPLPDFVKPMGYISKASPQGIKTLEKLLKESHFLIVPSIAECYGLVFCEANSYGVPCIGQRVGGIPTIIRDNINGHLFETGTDIQEYCNYITNMFSNYNQYKQLALSSFNEYQSRLNWSVAGKSVGDLLKKFLSISTL
jgi:glycosyltransferase involved in cell wall biosynthesis